MCVCIYICMYVCVYVCTYAYYLDTLSDTCVVVSDTYDDNENNPEKHAVIIYTLSFTLFYL